MQMTNILIKLFIKNKDLDENNLEGKYSMLASIIGIITNTVLAIIKLIIGILLNSISIMADATNNMTDSIANLMVIFSEKFAKKPADSEHPFGHAKVEYVSTFIIAVMMMLLGYELIQSSIISIIHPEEIGFDIILISILVISGLVKLWQSGCYKKLGLSANSEPLIALAKDSLNDVYIAIAIVSSIIFTHATGIIIDGYIGVFISLIILYTGFSVAKETISKILGESIDNKTATEIIDIVESHNMILDTHDLVVHRYGSANSMATILVDVLDKHSLQEVHIAIDEIERSVERKLGIKLLIRVTPILSNEPRFMKIKEIVQQFINEKDIKLNANDFKLIDKEDGIDVIFELDFPYEYDEDARAEMIVNLSKKIQTLDSTYNPIIDVGRTYILDEKEN